LNGKISDIESEIKELATKVESVEENAERSNKIQDAQSIWIDKVSRDNSKADQRLDASEHSL